MLLVNCDWLEAVEYKSLCLLVVAVCCVCNKEYWDSRNFSLTIKLFSDYFENVGLILKDASKISKQEGIECYRRRRRSRTQKWDVKRNLLVIIQRKNHIHNVIEGRKNRNIFP